MGQITARCEYPPIDEAITFYSTLTVVIIDANLRLLRRIHVTESQRVDGESESLGVGFALHDSIVDYRNGHLSFNVVGTKIHGDGKGAEIVALGGGYAVGLQN